MNKQERAAHIQRVLDDLYPDPPISLDHQDPFTLLVAVLLSAQCTDERVNKVTPALFALANTPQSMAILDVEAIRLAVQSCGLAPTKAKNIKSLSQQLLALHAGEVPSNFEGLEALPGVGHKTASVVMSQAFGKPALAVDTHIHRCAKRWGLSDGKNVEKTEADLKRLFPKKKWSKLHLQMIHFAREYCPAKQHDPAVCPICSVLCR